MTTVVAEPVAPLSFSGVQEAVMISGPSRGAIVQVRAQDQEEFVITPETATLLEQFAVAMQEVAQEMSELLVVSNRIAHRGSDSEESESL